MKTYALLFLILSSYVATYSLNADEARGCRIKEKEGKCCWTNNNGCCAPPKEGQVCTMAIRECCKIKKYDEENNSYEYIYE
jgi:hypothetical protein